METWPGAPPEAGPRFADSHPPDLLWANPSLRAFSFDKLVSSRSIPQFKKKQSRGQAPRFQVSINASSPCVQCVYR
jgi:hypothetical protein